jgi:hypothetical protein
VLLAIAAKRIDSELAAEVEVGVGDTTGPGVANTTGAGAGVAAGVGLEVGLAATFIPLLQTSLLPDLMQVNLKPLTVEVLFSFEQESPAFTAALATFKFNGRSKIAEQRIARNDFPLLIAK